MNQKKDDLTKIIGREYKYIDTAVLIPVVKINNKAHLLFQKRNSNIPQGDEICFPGGKVDRIKDKSIKDAIIREVCEELGITKNKIKIKEKLGILFSLRGIIVNAYSGVLKINDLSELKINISEVQKVFCIPVEWFRENPPEEYSVRIEVQPFYYDEDNKKNVLLPSKEIGLPEKYEKPWGGNIYPVFVYKSEYGIIWGITAELVKEFIKIKK